MEGSGENAGKSLQLGPTRPYHSQRVLVPDEVAHAESRQFFIQFEANVEALAHRLVYLMYGAVAGSPNLQSMTFETMRRAPKSFHKLIAIAIFNSMVHVARLVCPIAGGLVHEAFQIAYRALSEAEGVNRQGGLGSRAIQAMLSLGVLAILTPSILRDLGFPARLEPGALDGKNVALLFFTLPFSSPLFRF